MSRTHRARKRFGQHFLIDEHVLQRIADALRPAATDHLLEIGPGHGALTALLYGTTERYLAVELDRDLIAPLRARFQGLEVVNADILRVDLDALLEPPAWRIFGNLPYNISSPLLMKLFKHIERIRDMHFMFQRELGARLTGAPGTRDWGRLSVVTQLHCEVEALFDVPPEAFSPPPKVHSRMVRLTPRPAPEAVDHRSLDEVLRLAFSARRKRIANGLKTLNLNWEAVGVNQDARPEELTVDDFVNLANAVGQ